MARIRKCPTIRIEARTLVEWGAIWRGTEGSPCSDGTLAKKRPERFDKKQGTALNPVRADCVEVGTTRVIGGIRPRSYDVAYRPDGPRIVFDSKTLNDEGSIRKNWQNMLNDLASEAATVHTRFPYCLAAFIVVLPAPALPDTQRRGIASTLQRLGSRKDELDQHHLAEAIALVVREPKTGEIDSSFIDPKIRLDTMDDRIHDCHVGRYRHLPPHTT